MLYKLYKIYKIYTIKRGRNVFADLLKKRQKIVFFVNGRKNGAELLFCRKNDDFACCTLSCLRSGEFFDLFAHATACFSIFYEKLKL